MQEDSAGGFEYSGRGFRFRTATCQLKPGGDLYIQAIGRGCGLWLVGVPFPGTASVADLPGRAWDPDEDELALHADVFAEGGLEVRGNRLWIMRGRVICKRFDAEKGMLEVSFRLYAQDGEYGSEDEADGVAYCQVQ
jgi:hypothetical protein